jgi:DNA repair protein RadD
MIQLRYYQQEAIDSIYRYFYAKSGNPVVAMPTGTGKSIVIAAFVKSVLDAYPTQRVMMLTHVKELIGQNFSELLHLWPTAPAGVYSAGLKRRDVGHPITFAGIASVVKKAALFGHVDLVLVDECHLISPNAATQYGGFLNELHKVNPHLKVIGFTATNYRMGLGLLTEGTVFTDVCFDITRLEAFNKLIDEGYLVPLVPRKTRTELDVSGVGTHAGEYILKDLAAAVDREEITNAALDELVALGEAKRRAWLIFASGVEHSNHIAEGLVARGIPAVSVVSTDSAKRDEAIAGFRSGKYRAIVNNNILTTGFNHPAIDLIGVLRPTRSTGLWVQMLGRGTRPCEGKDDCLVLDFAGNTRRLGPINDPVIPKPKGSKESGSAPVKLCEKCGTYNHTSVRFCVCCGEEFKRIVEIESEASTAELIRRVKETLAPVYETFTVDNLTYRPHERAGKLPSIQVSYFCGLRMFKEWVCLSHEGYSKRRAHEWWRERSAVPPPSSTYAAIPFLATLRVPTRITVWTNRQYPEVISYDFRP